MDMYSLFQIKKKKKSFECYIYITLNPLLFIISLKLFYQYGILYSFKIYIYLKCLPK